MISPAPPRLTRVPWRTHAEFLHGNWRAGEHCSIISSTGGGKSHLTRKLLDLCWEHSRVIVNDPTEDDKNYGKPFKRLARFPRRIDRLRQRHWFRLVPPDEPKLASPVIREMYVSVMSEHDWVVVEDELANTTDSRAPGLGLAAYYAGVMKRARKRRVTMIAATQEPRWLPSAFYTQPKHIYIGYVGDEDVHKRLGEIGGVDKKQISNILEGLREYEFIYVGPRIGAHERRMEIIKAPA